jgi:hypothetical protein
MGASPPLVFWRVAGVVGGFAGGVVGAAGKPRAFLRIFLYMGVRISYLFPGEANCVHGLAGGAVNTSLPIMDMEKFFRFRHRGAVAGIDISAFGSTRKNFGFSLTAWRGLRMSLAGRRGVSVALPAPRHDEPEFDHAQADAVGWA